MPGDGILSIGATVDKTGVETGLSSIQDGVQQTVQTIAVQVEETCARSKAAWNKLSEDVKVGAQSVSSSWVKAAEDAKKLTAAQMDLRRATTLTKDASLDASSTTATLAAAQERVAAAAMAAAASMTAAKDEVVTAAEEEALSSNLIIRGFQRAALSVRESMTEIQEKLVETAETGKLSAEGITSGFAGLGALLGAGIALGFVTHFMDETSKVNVELGHLAGQTDISVKALAGLQGIVRSMGAEWDPVATGLNKMNKALADSGEPSKAFVSALGGINLTVGQLRVLRPEEQLQKIATAFSQTTNAGNRSAAAVALFGRGGYALIPVLREQGSELGHNIQLMQQQTGVTEESVAEAERWQRNISNVSRTFEHVGNVLVENMHYVEGGLLAIYESISAAVQMVWASLKSAWEGIAGIGKSLYDIATGNFHALAQDIPTVHELTQPFHDAAENIKADWTVVGNLFKAIQLPKEPKSDDSDPAADPAKGGGKSRDGKGSGSSAIYGPPAPPPTPQTASSSDLGGIDGAAIAKQYAESKSEMIAADRAQAEEKIRIAAEDYVDLQKSTEEEVRLGSMSEQQRIAALRAGSAEENQIRQQQSAFIQMLDLGDAKRYTDDLKQQEEITRQHARQIQQINAEIAQRQQQQFQQMFTAITGPMNTFFDHWLTSGRNMGQAFAKMGDQIAMNFINSEVKMLEHHLQMELQKRMITVTSNATQVASTASATAATTALETKAATQSLAKSAAKAAGKAWSALSDIPVVGPALGAAAAAATYAGVMALGVFDQGGIMGHGKMGVNLSGADERVLNPRQTQQFEKMVNQSTSSSSSSEVHFHDHSNWSGVDGASVEGMYRQHAASGRREMMRQLRLANQI